MSNIYHEVTFRITEEQQNKYGISAEDTRRGRILTATLKRNLGITYEVVDDYWGFIFDVHETYIISESNPEEDPSLFYNEYESSIPEDSFVQFYPQYRHITHMDMFSYLKEGDSTPLLTGEVISITFSKSKVLYNIRDIHSEEIFERIDSVNVR